MRWHADVVGKDMIVKIHQACRLAMSYFQGGGWVSEVLQRLQHLVLEAEAALFIIICRVGGWRKISLMGRCGCTPHAMVHRANEWLLETQGRSTAQSIQFEPIGITR